MNDKIVIGTYLASAGRHTILGVEVEVTPEELVCSQQHLFDYEVPDQPGTHDFVTLGCSSHEYRHPIGVMCTWCQRQWWDEAKFH